MPNDFFCFFLSICYFVLKKIQYNVKNEQFESQNAENIKEKNVFQFIDNYIQGEKSTLSLNSTIKIAKPDTVKTISKSSKKLSLLQPLHEKKMKVKYPNASWCVLSLLIEKFLFL